MIDTPQLSRGLLYTTHMASRCPSFNKCPACQACSAYSIHSLTCMICEKQKPLKARCHHTPRHKLAAIVITEKMKAPMFHEDYAPQSISTGFDNSAGEYDEILKSLPGRITLKDEGPDETIEV